MFDLNAVVVASCKHCLDPIGEFLSALMEWDGIDSVLFSGVENNPISLKGFLN